jgi:hypothetical protein
VQQQVNATLPGGIMVSSSISMYDSYALSNVVVANSAGQVYFAGKKTHAVCDAMLQLLNRITLPRQVRDKHGESPPKKRDAFACCLQVTAAAPTTQARTWLT